MANITVMNVSHYKRELNNFHKVLESGLGPDLYLFVHFLQPAAVTIKGVWHIVDKDACIIYTPGVRQEYKHYEGVFLNGFLVLKVDDPHFVARYGLPENEIFYITNADAITHRLELITYNVTNKLVDRSEQTLQHVHMLFETLFESCVNNDPGLKRMYETKQRFIALRDEVKNDPMHWTVDKMAKRAWLSRSRFSVLYNEIFSTSPGTDLIGIKVNHAKKLLTTTDMPISEISANCGYSSVEHFIRIFGKHEKCTPMQYRKFHKRSERR